MLKGHEGSPLVASELIEVLKRRMPDPESGVRTFLNGLKQIDVGWELFCKKHPNRFNEDAFRAMITNADEGGNIIRALGWDSKSRKH